jgi:zinc protease
MEGLRVQMPAKDWAGALAVAEQEIRRALKFGFTRSEVKRQIQALRESAEFDVRSASSRTTTGYILALMYADRVGRVFTDVKDDLERFHAEERRLTVAAVNAAFREAWADGPLISLTSSMPLASPESTIGKVYHASQQVRVRAPKDNPTPAFAYQSFGPAGKVVSREFDPVLGVTKVRFANNVLLNVRQMLVDKDRVHIRVSVRGGGADTRDLRGWRQAAVDTFLTGGLVAHDYPTLEDIRGGRMVNWGFSTEPDAVILTGETDQKDLTFQLQVLTAYVSAPAFRLGPMTQFHRQVEASYDSNAASALATLNRQFWSVITSNNPYLSQPTKDDLLGWTSERLRRAVSPILNQGNIEIGVVGSASPDDVIKSVARTFGALPARPLKAVELIDRHVTFARPTPTPITLLHDGPASQAVAAVYWPVTDGDDPRRRAISSLTGAILQQRMFDRIREKEGSSYSPMAGSNLALSHFFAGFGYLVAAIDIASGQADKGLKTIDEVVASLGEGISQDELDRARSPTLERLRVGNEDALNWVDPVSHAQSEPTRTRAWLERAEIYRSVTLDDIQAAAWTYLNPEHAVKILVLPRDKGADRSSAN